MEWTYSNYWAIKYYNTIILIIQTLETEKHRELCIQVLDFISATEGTHDYIKMF